MTRVRSRLEGPVTGYHKRYRNGVFYNQQGCVVSSKDEVISDTVTAGYRKLVAAGAIINNTCVYSKNESIVEGSGVYKAVRKSPGLIWEIYGDGCLTQKLLTEAPGFFQGAMPDTSGPNSLETMRDLAKANALSRIDSTPYSFAEDIFEWKQAVKFLKKPLGSLSNLSKSFSKDVSKLSSRKKALSRAKAIADVWLEYRFAFSPLLRSAEDFIEAWQSIETRPPRETARGNQSHAAVKDADYTVTSGANTFWSTKGSSTSVEVRAGVLYEVTNPIMDWRDKYGLRTKDLPRALWDIFPYSFMIDRVSRVGDCISGLTNLLDPNVKILAAWDTKKVFTETRFSITKQVNTSYNCTITPDTKIERSFSYVRDPWLPDIRDTLPSILPGGLIDDTTKIADLVALVIQRLR